MEEDTQNKESTNEYTFDPFDPFLITLKPSKSFTETKTELKKDSAKKKDTTNAQLKRSDSIENNYFGYGIMALNENDKRITKTRSASALSHTNTVDFKTRPSDESAYFDLSLAFKTNVLSTPKKNGSDDTVKVNEVKSKYEHLLRNFRVEDRWNGLNVRFFECLLPYCAGIDIALCRLVSLVWYNNISAVLWKRCEIIVDEFMNVYKNAMEYNDSFMIFQPVLTATKSVKIDVIIRARVTSKCVLYRNNFGYTYSYCENYSKKLKGKDNSNAIFINKFVFDVLKKNSNRNIAFTRDVSCAHADDFNVANYATVCQVCEDDFIEFPVTLINALGVTNHNTLKFSLLSQESIGNNTNKIDQLHREWYTVEPNSEYLKQLFPQNINSYSLVEPDKLKPQLVHQNTQVAGIDIITSRSNYVADKCGHVEESCNFLGHTLEVVNRFEPITCLIERVGIQHDRTCHVQLRPGDLLQLYLTKG